MAQVFNVSDDFSPGPYNVDIVEGNEQDRFEIENGTYTAPNAPVTPAPPTFILDGETIVLCPNATDNPLDPIPNINSGEYVICEYVICLPTEHQGVHMQELIQKCPRIPVSNWNLEVLVFEGGENREEKPLGAK